MLGLVVPVAALVVAAVLVAVLAHSRRPRDAETVYVTLPELLRAEAQYGPKWNEATWAAAFVGDLDWPHKPKEDQHGRSEPGHP